MEIRDVANTDHAFLLPMLHKMHEESGLNLPAVDDAKVLESLGNCDAVLITEEDGKPTGILALSIGEHWFSKDLFIGDLIFYVDSSARASRAAVKLLQEGQKYAKIRDLPLMVAVVDGKDIERKDAFYQRCGFQKAGGVYVWNMGH